MKKKSIKSILQDLLSFDPNRCYLRKEDIQTSCSLESIKIVKSQSILLEVVSTNYNSEELRLYRLNQNPKNIKRAKALLELFP